MELYCNDLEVNVEKSALCLGVLMYLRKTAEKEREYTSWTNQLSLFCTALVAQCGTTSFLIYDTCNHVTFHNILMKENWRQRLKTFLNHQSCLWFHNNFMPTPTSITTLDYKRGMKDR